MNIVLIGFMGVGKTEVGKILSKRLKKKYISTDSMIVEKEGKSIKDIFSEKGENSFRKIEKKIIENVSCLDNVVIDTGGGVVKNKENIINLKKKGILICLKAEPKTIYKRVKNQKHRPLLNVDNPLDAIKHLLKEREKYYKKSDFYIDTNGLDIDQVVEKIIKKIKQKN